MSLDHAALAEELVAYWREHGDVAFWKWCAGWYGEGACLLKDWQLELVQAAAVKLLCEGLDAL